MSAKCCYMLHNTPYYCWKRGALGLVKAQWAAVGIDFPPLLVGGSVGRLSPPVVAVNIPFGCCTCAATWRWLLCVDVRPPWHFVATQTMSSVYGRWYRNVGAIIVSSGNAIRIDLYQRQSHHGKIGAQWNVTHFRSDLEHDVRWLEINTFGVIDLYRNCS